MFQLLFIILHNILQVTGHENIINFPVYSGVLHFLKGFFFWPKAASAKTSMSLKTYMDKNRSFQKYTNFIVINTNLKSQFL